MVADGIRRPWQGCSPEADRPVAGLRSYPPSDRAGWAESAFGHVKSLITSEDDIFAIDARQISPIGHQLG